MPRNKRKEQEGKDKLTIGCYLILDEKLNVSVRNRKPSLTGGQVAIRLDITLPSDFFIISVPVAKLEIAREHILQPPVEVVMRHALDKL